MKKQLNALPEEIADWMLERLKQVKGDLYQYEVVADIYDRFGAKFTYTNANGNSAIRADILKAFRKLTKETVVWNRSERYWRFRQRGDSRKTRMVEW